ncbi:MAG: VOC family protein [Candidatus Nanopelagicaceae bacterium]
MLKIQCITFDCQDPAVPAKFWSQALDWPITIENSEEVVVTNPAGEGDLLFMRNPDKRTVKNRVHFDLRPDNQQAEVARLESLGARRVEIGQSADPRTTWIVMEDPEGNLFCVLRTLDNPDIKLYELS